MDPVNAMSVSREELDNFIYVAKNKDSMRDDDPRYRRAINFTLPYFMTNETPYALLESGPGMTSSDKARIMKGMDSLYQRYGNHTFAVWLSKDSCPFISFNTQ